MSSIISSAILFHMSFDSILWAIIYVCLFSSLGVFSLLLTPLSFLVYLHSSDSNIYLGLLWMMHHIIIKRLTPLPVLPCNHPILYLRVSFVLAVQWSIVPVNRQLYLPSTNWLIRAVVELNYSSDSVFCLVTKSALFTHCLTVTHMDLSQLKSYCNS